MLHFENVSKSFLIRGRMKPIISNATFTAHFEDNYALTVPIGGGKSTICNMIYGSEQPDVGKIYRYGKISWPVGGVNTLIHPLSGAENCRYIAMIYGLDPDDVLAFVIDLVRIGRYMDMPVRTFSSTLQARLSLALLLALDFDMYLVVDGANIGDDEFSERAGPILEQKLNYTPVMYMASEVKQIPPRFKRVAVLHECRVYEFDSLEDAAAFETQEAVVYG